MLKNNPDTGEKLSESPKQNKELSKKMKDRLRFVQLKVGKILKLDKKQRQAINIPEYTLSRMFQKDTINLKKRFQVSKRLGGIQDIQREFQNRKDLLDTGDMDYKKLHELEVLYYILKNTDSNFLDTQSLDTNWFKEKYRIILVGAIKQRVNEFEMRGKYTPSRRKLGEGPIDIKKMRKLFQFRDILHHYGFTDEDIGITKEKFDEIRNTIDEITLKTRAKMKKPS